MRFGSPDADYVAGLAIDKNENILVTGTTANNSHLFHGQTKNGTMGKIA